VRSSDGIVHRAVRTKFNSSLCALALLAGGCAGAPAGLQKDGSYVLEQDERIMDCQRLHNGIWGRLQLMKALPERARAERQKSPPTAALALGRLFGGQDKGLATLAEYDREHAHVRALHRTAIDKGCPPIDVERELAATDAVMAEFRKP
jgi:hypothetical protein